jgi:hypothetical protein
MDKAPLWLEYMDPIFLNIFPISICLLNQPSSSQLLRVWRSSRPAQLVPGNFRRNAQICNMAINSLHTSNAQHLRPLRPFKQALNMAISPPFLTFIDSAGKPRAHGRRDETHAWDHHLQLQWSKHWATGIAMAMSQNPRSPIAIP